MHHVSFGQRRPQRIGDVRADVVALRVVAVAGGGVANREGCAVRAVRSGARVGTGDEPGGVAVCLGALSLTGPHSSRRRRTAAAACWARGGALGLQGFLQAGLEPRRHLCLRVDLVLVRGRAVPAVCAHGAVSCFWRSIKGAPRVRARVRGTRRGGGALVAAALLVVVLSVLSTFRRRRDGVAHHVGEDVAKSALIGRQLRPFEHANAKGDGLGGGDGVDGVPGIIAHHRQLLHPKGKVEAAGGGRRRGCVVATGAIPREATQQGVVATGAIPREATQQGVVDEKAVHDDGAPRALQGGGVEAEGAGVVRVAQQHAIAENGAVLPQRQRVVSLRVNVGRGGRVRRREPCLLATQGRCCPVPGSEAERLDVAHTDLTHLGGAAQAAEARRRRAPLQGIGAAASAAAAAAVVVVLGGARGGTEYAAEGVHVQALRVRRHPAVPPRTAPSRGRGGVVVVVAAALPHAHLDREEAGGVEGGRHGGALLHRCGDDLVLGVPRSREVLLCHVAPEARAGGVTAPGRAHVAAREELGVVAGGEERLEHRVRHRGERWLHEALRQRVCLRACIGM